MSKTKKKGVNKPRVAVTLLAMLSFVSFISNILEALKDGHLSATEFGNLMSSAEGFESVALVIIAIIWKKRK